MKIEQTFELSIKQLTIGIVLFVVFFLITFVSRSGRIAQSKAIIGTSNSKLYLNEEVGIDELISILNSAGIEFDEEELRWVSPLLGWKKFKKGHYNFDGEYGYNEFLTKLAFGSQDPVSITILPGITLERFSRNLGMEMSFDSIDVAEVFNDSLFTSSKKVSKEQLFGRMLPDTYSIYWTSSVKNTVDKILDEFNSKVTKPYKSRIDSMGYAVDEIVAMASIVEWEANIEDEKPVVAGLYWNRIDRRMYLQADPTISFAVGERRRLLLEDYKVDHPYNTYTKYGLPPGPVTNPSLQTIEATLYPENHNYLYMVASPEGGHIFNRTYEQHLVDAEKWRKWLRQQYRIKRQRELDASGD
ncbi:MAG: endolytic transglycosylase MltG [Balneola sp.]